MKRSFLAVLLLMFTGVSFAQSSADESAVWAAVDALNSAVFATKDSNVIKELVSEKLTYGHSGGNVEDKPTMVRNASVSPTVYRNPTTERINLFFIDKNTAVARYIFRATSVDKGAEAPLNISLLQVWTKEKKKWKLVARQAVRVAPK